MKKIKLALVALTTVLGVGGAIAGTSGAGDYYTSQNGSTEIAGVKGANWDCSTDENVTCAYQGATPGQRQRVEGQHFEINP